MLSAVVLSLSYSTSSRELEQDVSGSNLFNSTHPYSLLTGENYFNYSYTICNNCTIGDYVWQDLNYDGIQDEGEPGISDVQMILCDVSGYAIQITETDINGRYSFAKLCYGNYTIDVNESTLPPGYKPTISKSDDNNSIDSNGSLNGCPVRLKLDVDKCNDSTIDFGYVHCNSTIGDFVWYDKNYNGIQENGEPGIPGVLVILFEGTTGNIFAETITDSTGHYLFEDLCPGNYIVSIDSSTLPELSPTISYVDYDDSVDSDGSLDANGTISAPVLIILGDEPDFTIDLGFINKDRPNIRIKVEFGPDIPNRLKLDISSKDNPDIFHDNRTIINGSEFPLPFGEYRYNISSIGQDQDFICEGIISANEIELHKKVYLNCSSNITFILA